MSEEERVAFADENHLLIRYLFDAAIDHEKPLFVLANGPGIGLGTVILGELKFSIDHTTQLRVMISLSNCLLIAQKILGDE